ncbi:STAS domain-containing protein [Cellulomonas massiliensis]|uniref:STAS domain-containing protein n=1 Tax=Cellulomonas massiliensis TaxID=1465811 RepID=UPI0002FDD068|nr:STAS domain-containing protein [Cellulomonas massiliensis]
MTQPEPDPAPLGSGAAPLADARLDEHDGRLVVVLTGEVDAALSGTLAQVVAAVEQRAAAGDVAVDVDAGAVTFMDSSGLRFLARLSTRTPHRVRVLHAPEAVRFLLQATRMADVVDVVG